MNYKRVAVLFSSLAVAATVMPGVARAAEKERIVLQPAGAWHLDMGENRCRLVREFGSDDERSVFYLEQWSPSSSATWLVAGPPFKRHRASREVTATFGPEGDRETFEFVPSTLGDFGAAISEASTIAFDKETPDGANGYDPVTATAIERPGGLPILDAAGMAQVERLTIAQNGRPDVVFELGNMGSGAAAMNTCMTRLIQQWGLDLEEQRSVVSAPQLRNPDTVVQRIVSYYPASAMYKGAQANFHLRVVVSATGEMESCQLLNQSLADDFDLRRLPCKAFEEKARFYPALDARGHGVRSYYTTNIRYRSS